jgi:hypothetical protein
MTTTKKLNERVTVRRVAERVAAKVFSLRSRPGRRNVEVHLSEAELVAVIYESINLAWTVGAMHDTVAACETPKEPTP